MVFGSPRSHTSFNSLFYSHIVSVMFSVLLCVYLVSIANAQTVGVSS